MRRFSQRSHLVTLSEINITPLLDLAFVLLIIFVITTPLLEQGLNLQLPKGGRPDRGALRREDVRTIEVSPKGHYVYAGRPLSLAQVEQALLAELRANPGLVAYIRADKGTTFDAVFQLTDLCATHGILVSLRSEPRLRP